MNRNRYEDVFYAWFLGDDWIAIFVMGGDFFCVFDTEDFKWFFIFSSKGDAFVASMGDVSAKFRSDSVFYGDG